MGATRFMVQWEEHPSHLATRLGQLLEHQTLVDVTLMCNTHTLRVHRAVLAACSPYFETILQRQLGMHPLIVLKDMQFSVLKSLIEFMYCGETSVTEDNLGALLQAAKFFQVKGLSAMTKEALGLVPSPKSTVNGDAARKTFVGRPKRVGMQQTFVTSGLKTPAAHASGSHVTSATTNDLPTLSTKTTFQTISKPVAARPDTQQQTDTAQLLLSLSGSEFPKQTFHTVSKNVRFQHNVSGSAVSSGTVESNAKKEVVGRIPVKTTPNGGMKTATAVTQLATEPATVASSKEDILVTNPQSVYIAEGNRRRGRPVKRQVNMLFQERVMTDADVALHKEAEASRKALEMLRQEMSSDPIDANAASSSTVAVASVAASPAPVGSPSTSSTAQGANVSAEQLQKALVKQTASSGTKIQVQPAQPPAATNARTITASQPASNPSPAAKRMNTNVVYKTVTNQVTSVGNKKNPPATSNLPEPSNNSNAMNVSFKVDEAEIPQQVYQLASEVAQEAPQEGNVEYQVSAETAEGEVDGGANIVYQVADASGAPAGSVMSQYMEVLKEAGLPTDVPILLDSGDGSYVTVNEEVLMNIVNGGVLQCHVTEGNIVAGEGLEFIVQEFTEDEMDAVAPVAENTGEGMELPKEDEGEVAQVVGDSISAETDNVPMEEGQTSAEDHTILPNMEEGNCIIPEMEPEPSAMVASQAEEMQCDEAVSDSVMKCVTNMEAKEEVMNTLDSSEDIPRGTYDEMPEGTFSDSSAGQQPPEMALSNQEAYEGVCELTNHEPAEEEAKEPAAGQEDEMSVEQALQAMMGEGSDTETETCSRDNDQNTVKEEVSELETTSQPLKEEPPEDLHLVLRSEEGTEDLRLVLSHEEELMKEERASEEDSSSFTLVLSPGNEGSSEVSEDATRNEQLKAEVSLPGEDVEQQLAGVEGVLADASESVPQTNEFDNSSEGCQEGQHLQVETGSDDMALSQECTSGDVHEAENDEELGHTQLLENAPGNDMSGENEEILQLTSNTVALPAECVLNAATKTKGAVISPSKDIPYAVGLLPLKTALEKLQAMPEYHPRKTRSSSTGKESTPDMPAARVKRKASSSDGPDKRFKMCPSEADTIVEQPSAEEEGEEATMQVVASEPEERQEGTVLSMPELTTEPTEG